MWIKLIIILKEKLPITILLQLLKEVLKAAIHKSLYFVDRAMQHCITILADTLKDNESGTFDSSETICLQIYMPELCAEKSEKSPIISLAMFYLYMCVCVIVLINDSAENLSAFLHRGLVYTALRHWRQATADFEVVIKLGRWCPGLLRSVTKIPSLSSVEQVHQRQAIVKDKFTEAWNSLFKRFFLCKK